MNKSSSALDMINPLHSFTARAADYKKAPGGSLALSKDPETNMALWNTIGVAGTLLPATAIIAYMSNELKKRNMKKEVDLAVESTVNAMNPVLNPDSNLDTVSNITDRPVKELKAIDNAMAELTKKASGSSDPDGLYSENGLLKSVALRALPVVAAPAAIYLAAAATNKYLKKKYRRELDEENAQLENLQDAMDIKTLEDMGYIKKSASLYKRAGVVDSAIRSLYRTGGTVYDVAKKSTVNLPITLALGLLATGTAVGIPYFYKRLDSVRKLKEVEKSILGSNKTMRTPALIVELPKDYETTNKKTAQILPGIDNGQDQLNVVEDAQIVENPKKDVFLG